MKATYSIWIKKNSSLKMPPSNKTIYQCSGYFCSNRNFQTLIKKNKFYHKSLYLKSVVFVSDMDKIALALYIFFGMILYWNIKYVNQSIIC
jgi:hypothetical protein